ncbi:MAG: V-type ATP synthase subunit I [Bacteroidia bacterium]
MVEPMYKIVLICETKHTDLLLEKLQEFGKAHIDDLENTSPPQQLYKQAEDIKEAIEILRKLRKQKKQYIQQYEFRGNEDEWVNLLLQKTKLLNEIKEQILKLENKKKETEKWSNLKTSFIKELRHQNIPMKLFACKNSDIKLLSTEFLQSSELVKETHDEMYYLLIKNVEITSLSLLRILKEIPLPEMDAEELNSKLKQLINDYMQINEWLYGCVHYVRFLRNKLMHLQDTVTYLKAAEAAKFQRNEYLTMLTVWIPKQYKIKFEETISSLPVVHVIDKPKTYSEVPVSLKQNAFGNLFVPLTKLFSIPSYTELDPTVFFAPFFTLYFGICGADIGYGLIMLLASIFIYFSSSNKQINQYAKLGIILSASVAFSGLLYGVFFGSNINNFSVFKPLTKLNVLGDMPSAFSFALFIGVVQMLTGFVIRLVNRYNQLGWQGVMQPVGFILVLAAVFCFSMLEYGDVFVPANIHIGKYVKQFAENSLLPYVLAVTGIFFILFFSSLNQNILKRPLEGLWHLYSLITGIPTDVLSYLRLFALGLSGALLGNAINMVAFSVNKGSIVSIAGMIIILLIGHSINFALVLLSAFVHPLRLTFVEFYKSIDFKGGGKEYNPFKKLTKKTYH